MKQIFFLILISLLSNAVFPQQYEVSVTTITVWVKASDKSGNAVRNLAPADFEIYEDNKIMEPTCFEEVGSPNKVNQSTPAFEQPMENTSTQPEEARRKMVLFVDLFNTSMAEYQRVRKTTDDFITQINQKQWDVMLAAMTNTGKAGVVIPFGNDLKNISEQLPLLKPNAERDVAVMNRKRTISQMLKIDPSRIAEAYRLAATYANLEKHDSEKSIFAFDELADYLQKIIADEHVIVVYISGGINLQPGRVYFEMVNNFVGEAATLDSANFASTFPGSIREPNFDINRKIKQSIGRLNKKNITIYCLNTRGTANPADDNIHEDSRVFIVSDTTLLKDFQESLDQIADETGGISFRNSNNFTKGFTDILKDSEHQYIVCYNAPEQKEKGKYHEIKVVSRKPNVNLRYRKGYVN